MVILIQNRQKRDTREIHLKLDELILVNSKSRDDFMELDRFSDDDLPRVEQALNAPARSVRPRAKQTAQSEIDPARHFSCKHSL
jgi:low affinity Fe/Cu permease